MGDSISAGGLAAIAILFGAIAVVIGAGIAFARNSDRRRSRRRRRRHRHRIDLFARGRDAGEGRRGDDADA